MKFIKERGFADPDDAVRKLVEITNAVEAVQDGRIYVERINGPFLDAGGAPRRWHGLSADLRSPGILTLRARWPDRADLVWFQNCIDYVPLDVPGKCPHNPLKLTSQN
jgi:hypothetical protein